MTRCSSKKGCNPWDCQKLAGVVANLGSLSYLGYPSKMPGGAAAGWAIAGISGLVLAYNILSDKDPFSSKPEAKARAGRTREAGRK